MANAPKPHTARKPPMPSDGHADIGDWIRRVWLLYLVAGVARPAVAQVDQPRAQQFFKEAQALCERDGGRLWGVSICAPMVIVDRRTQTIATSQPAPAGARPRELGFVNAPIHWGGATWGAYMWDDVVSKTPRDRNELFLHELFHGVQAELGVGAPAGPTEHLDAADGRDWLRLGGCGGGGGAPPAGPPLRGGRTVLVAARVARARAGPAGIRTAAHTRGPRRTRVPAGPARTLSSQRRRRARPGDHGRPRRVHGQRRRGAIFGGRDRESARPAGRCGVRGKLRAHVCVLLRSRVWPPARCRVSRLDATGARQRRSRHAPDGCARRPTRW